MAAYYAQRAREYERIYQKAERQADLEKLQEFVASTFAGTRVFEVACGTGYWTQILARSAASVFATDINDEVLAIARSKGMDPRKVTLQKANAYELPPLSQRFNGGLAAFWWSHISKSRVRDFLVGFHRLLSPGARAVFIDNVYVEGSSTPLSRVDEEGNSYQIRRLEDGSTHEVLKNFLAEEELRATVEGLSVEVRVQSLQYYWILTYTLP